jgi:hypothetical protein
MLKSKKNVFWEAFFVAVVIFLFGLVLGLAFENTRLRKISDYYSESEIALMDVLVMSNFVELDSSKCSDLIQMNLDFADKVYKEAKLMEKYFNAGKLNEDSFWIVHKRYDILRTFLWVNSLRILEKCPESDFSSIVYLYEYKTEDINKKAIQGVWSKVLGDLKAIYGEKIVLIPIAVDSDLLSLKGMISEFEISEFPVVIINNKFLITELSSVEELRKYLE